MQEQTQRRKTIYQEVIERGIEHCNHNSDLYIPVTEETKELVQKYKLSGIMASTFYTQDDKTLWYDIPFAYMPYWEEKLAGSPNEIAK